MEFENLLVPQHFIWRFHLQLVNKDLDNPTFLSLSTVEMIRFRSMGGRIIHYVSDLEKCELIMEFDKAKNMPTPEDIYLNLSGFKGDIDVRLIIDQLTRREFKSK